MLSIQPQAVATTIIYLFLLSGQWIRVKPFVFRNSPKTINLHHVYERSPWRKEAAPTNSKPATQLWLAGPRRSTGNKKNRPKNRKKKTSGHSNATKGGKTRNKNNSTSSKKRGRAENPMAAAPAGSKTPQNQKRKKVAPPWQTLSRRDIQKNAEAEKNRREIARDTGSHLTPLQMEEIQESYQRSTAFLSQPDKELLNWKPFGRINPNLQEVLFQGAFLNKQKPPRLGTPEVAFLGRSNVGKSSLLNTLVGKSDLARVGKTPGATASVNLYGVFNRQNSKKTAGNDNRKALLGLVDLPGFGYAKLSKETKKSVQETAENYLAKRKELALGILLVDSRRTPTSDDKAVLAALYDMGLPLMVVATKVDKFSTQAKVDKALELINTELGLPEGQPLCISCVTGAGIRDLWKILMEACEGHVQELKTKAETGASSQEALPSGDEDEAEEYYDDGDDGEIAYSQGYDWIQGSVRYEAEDGDYKEDYYDLEDDDAGYLLDDSYDDFGDEPEPTMPQKETLKNLRIKAREMERRGEFGRF